MAKFIYKMQNILDIKYKLEDQAKTEFSIAVSRLRSEEEKLEAIYASIEECQTRIRKMSEEKLDVRELSYMSESIEFKKEQAKIQKKQIQLAEINVERARVKLNDVMIDRKTHEKLKDNAFEEFKREINEEEKKEIDELISFRGNK